MIDRFSKKMFETFWNHQPAITCYNSPILISGYKWMLLGPQQALRKAPSSWDHMKCLYLQHILFPKYCPVFYSRGHLEPQTSYGSKLTMPASTAAFFWKKGKAIVSAMGLRLALRSGRLVVGPSPQAVTAPAWHPTGLPCPLSGFGFWSSWKDFRNSLGMSFDWADAMHGKCI
jgi:hypothetical protein